jgi:hypothetical protein
VSNAARLARRVIARAGGRWVRLDEGSTQRTESAAVFARGRHRQAAAVMAIMASVPGMGQRWHAQAKAVSMAGFLQRRAASPRRRT